ncbi:MAG: adenosylcobinamide-phosphate synthase CbiB, partial [Spirochaetota bacterium]
TLVQVPLAAAAVPAFGRAVSGLPAWLHSGLRAALTLRPVDLVLVYFLFCNRDMAAEARAVYRRLAAGDLEGARLRVGRIVGRDTGELDSRGVIRAAVESVAESLVDGVGAPLLYLVLGGAPLAYAYRTVNTIDSRFGYRDRRYERFGKAGARLDDLLNFVPSRLNALFLFAASGMDPRVWRSMRRFGRKHPSPNSGIAEAGFAGALGMALGGPSRYGGVLEDRPVLGRDRLSEEELDDPRLILQAVALYWRVTAVSLACHAALLVLPALPLFGAP